MADDIETNVGTGGKTVRTDDVGGLQYQVIKIAIGGDGVDNGLVGAPGVALPITEVKAASSVTTSVAGSIVNVNLLIANAARLGATIYADIVGAPDIYVKLGATASSTSFTVKLSGGDYYEVPFGYTGIIDGIWTVASGNARITELSA